MPRQLPDRGSWARGASILWKGLFAYASLVPFYYLQPVQFAVDASSLAALKYLPFLAATLLALVALVGYSKSTFISKLPLRTEIGLYLAASALSVLYAEEFAKVGLLKLIYYSLTGIFLPFLVLRLINDRPAIFEMVQWMVGVGSLVAAYGLFVYAYGRDPIWGEFYLHYNPYYTGQNRLSATLGNAVFAAAYFSLCLPYAIWMHSVARSKQAKRISRASVVLLATALVLTFSRGGWIAGALVAVIVLFPRLKTLGLQVRKALEIRRIVVWVTILLLAIPILHGVGMRDMMARSWATLWVRIGQAIDFSETESFRLAQYGTTARVMKEHPLLGVGFGGFTRLFHKYKSEATPTGLITTTTENMYLMVACETGILGLALFLLLLGTVGATLLSRLREAQDDVDRGFRLASLACLMSFCLNMLTWDALNQPTVRMTFWIFIGLGLAKCELQSSRVRS